VLHGLCINEFLIGMYGVDEVDNGDRLAANCRGFTVLATAMLRAHGVPARARCGSGAARPTRASSV
jgi:transglutaminase-like putative cysteine protease